MRGLLRGRGRLRRLSFTEYINNLLEMGEREMGGSEALFLG